MNIFYEACNSEEGLNNTIAILHEKVCEHHAEDVEGCKLGVEQWWPEISSLIFTNETSPYVCNALNQDCDLPAKKGHDHWDCHNCQKDLQAVAKLYRTYEVGQMHIEYLQGELFCGGMDLDEDMVYVCKTIIREFIPPAFKAIFTYVESHTHPLCNHIYDGVCDIPEDFDDYF